MANRYGPVQRYYVPELKRRYAVWIGPENWAIQETYTESQPTNARIVKSEWDIFPQGGIIKTWPVVVPEPMWKIATAAFYPVTGARFQVWTQAAPYTFAMQCKQEQQPEPDDVILGTTWVDLNNFLMAGGMNPEDLPAGTNEAVKVADWIERRMGRILHKFSKNKENFRYWGGVIR